MHNTYMYNMTIPYNLHQEMIKRIKDAVQLWCFTLPYLYCTYSPAIAHPHYCLWFTWFIFHFGFHCVICLLSTSVSTKA